MPLKSSSHLAQELRELAAAHLVAGNIEAASHCHTLALKIEALAASLPGERWTDFPPSPLRQAHHDA